ncbi:hypothetical protein PINS_up001626 [Pythium insidiosum]|nr:hypothetical protein PINS_up001626 [Pythium insidiosum]
MCREMQRSASNVPIQRSRPRAAPDANADPVDDDADGEVGSIISSVDTPQQFVSMDEAKFLIIQEMWNKRDIDVHFVTLLDSIAANRSIESPSRLTFSDVSSALVLYDIVEEINELLVSITPDDGSFSHVDKECILVRLLLIRSINQRIFNVFKLWMDSSDTYGGVAVSFDDVITPNIERKDDASGERLNPQNQNVLEALITAANTVLPPRRPIRLPSGKAVQRQSFLLAATLYLFASQKEALISELIADTMTQTPPPSMVDKKPGDSCDEVSDARDIARLRLQLSSLRVAPFWLTSHRSGGVNRAKHWLPEEGKRDLSMFGQLTQQLATIAPKEFRREFVSSFEPLAVPRTFYFEIEGASSPQAPDSGDKIGQDIAEDPSNWDPSTAYVRFLDRVITEIQSPVFPLFTTDAATQGERSMTLDVNSELLLPEVADLAGIRREDALRWFFHVGQLLGIAWRSKLVLPLQHISKAFWRDLVLGKRDDEAPSSTTIDRAIQARWCAIEAVRDGLSTVVPADCLVLVSPSSLQQRLSAGLELISLVDNLRARAVFDSEAPHHRMFWCVASAFSCHEKQLLLQFLTGSSFRPTHPWPHKRDAIGEWKRMVREASGVAPDESTDDAAPDMGGFVVEITEALADAQDHPDACFPVVLVTSPQRCRLHLPSYSSLTVMRTKLVFAMSNSPAI